MKLKKSIYFLFLVFSFHSVASAHKFEVVKPESVGISSERLNRITDVFNEKISTNKRILPKKLTLSEN